MESITELSQNISLFFRSVKSDRQWNIADGRLLMFLRLYYKEKKDVLIWKVWKVCEGYLK